MDHIDTKLDAKVLTIDDLKNARMERDYFRRWMEFYKNQAHEDLLDELIYEHEHNFPMRCSGSVMDRMRHRALIEILDQRAQTEFLRSFLREINATELMN